MRALLIYRVDCNMTLLMYCFTLRMYVQTAWHVTHKMWTFSSFLEKNKIQQSIFLPPIT